MTGGFIVEPEALERFSNDMPSYAQQATKFQDLVSRADVGNESWGLVGLYTKQGYDELLSKLQQLLGQLKQGCENAGQKFQSAAETYQRIDEQAARDLSSIGRTVEV